MDKTFGIRFKNGNFGTPGLWTLITEKYPKEYDDEDYERYKELIYETNMLYRDHDTRSSYPRTNRSI